MFPLIDLAGAPYDRGEIFWIQPQDGILVHANHWVSHAAQAKLRDTGLGTTVDSLYRQRRTEAAMYGAISTTVCTTIMQPALGEMSIARKPWVERVFHRYSLS